jgi:hypothetical protein
MPSHITNEFQIEKETEDKVFEIPAYKGLVIALILNTGQLLKVELFDQTCERFWLENVVQHERKYPMPWQEHIYHTFQGEIVVGYHCSDKEPTVFR